MATLTIEIGEDTLEQFQELVNAYDQFGISETTLVERLINDAHKEFLLNIPGMSDETVQR